MVRHNESEIRFLIRQKILFEPARLLVPEYALLPLVPGNIRDVAINHGKVRVSPIERVVRRAFMKDILEIVGVAFVISKRREESGLPQQFVLDLEEDWPLRAVVSVFNHVAGLKHEI